MGLLGVDQNQIGLIAAIIPRSQSPLWINIDSVALNCIVLKFVISLQQPLSAKMSEFLK